MSDIHKLLQAKIPCAETGIEVKQTICSICSPTHHCGIDAYIKDGKVVKIEGTKEHPVNHGLLCTKGLANREYIYRKDRIKTPLKRVGKRGEGRFEPLSWEKAYDEIANNLNEIKKSYGPEAVSFFSGHSKWYRPYLERLAYSFGSPNFGNESSTCFNALLLAWRINTGGFAVSDIANANTVLVWTVNPYYSSHLRLSQIYKAKENGAKIVVIDPRVTPTATKLSDLHLQIKPGTDGALALGMAKIIIENNLYDKEFVENFTYGFDEFKEYALTFNIDLVSKITGVSGDLIYKATELYAKNGLSAIMQSASSGVHHRNGLQNCRAIISLVALTGNYGIKGGNIPLEFTYIHQGAGFKTREEEFIAEKKPQNALPRVGAKRFPIWNELIGEDQSCDLARHIIEEKPYPIKSILALGMNYRMFPDSSYILQAIKKLDFFVNVDLFMTETCKYADIVLPACSSFERSEFKVYTGGYAIFTNPVIDPLYESKSDTDIITDLANCLNVDDELLKSGYDNCVKWIIKDNDISIKELKNSPYPLKVSDSKPFFEKAYLKEGFNTPTGKFEFKSTIIEKYSEQYGIDPLPTYKDSLDNVDENEYPLILTSGARLPMAFNSRLHKVSCTKYLHPEPTVDINIEDAEVLNIKKGDMVKILTSKGEVIVKAKPSHKILKGNIHMYHGYEEVDVNLLFDKNHLDPISGFPGFKSVRCKIEKAIKDDN